MCVREKERDRECKIGERRRWNRKNARLEVFPLSAAAPNLARRYGNKNKVSVILFSLLFCPAFLSKGKKKHTKKNF